MSRNSTPASKAATLAQLQALISGLQKKFPNGQFTLGNAAFTTATLVQALQRLVDAIDAVNAAQATAKVAVSALRAAVTEVGPVVLALRRTLLAMFGNANDILALFGLEPRKAPRPRTSQENAVAAAKAEATRKARGTTSKKKKLAIVGNVTGIEVIPIRVPSDSAPSAQPAPATPTVSPSGTAGR